MSQQAEKKSFKSWDQRKLMLCIDPPGRKTTFLTLPGGLLRSSDHWRGLRKSPAGTGWMGDQQGPPARKWGLTAGSWLAEYWHMTWCRQGNEGDGPVEVSHSPAHLQTSTSALGLQPREAASVSQRFLCGCLAAAGPVLVSESLTSYGNIFVPLFWAHNFKFWEGDNFHSFH